MDLLGRKLGLRKGEIFMHFLQNVRASIQEAEKIADLRALCEQLEAALNRYGEVAVFLSKKAMGSDIKLAFSHAHPFLDVTGDIIMAWMLLWRAARAYSRLEDLTAKSPHPEERAAPKRETAFLNGQLKTAAYFITMTLPITIGKIKGIMQADTAAILEMNDNNFGA
jgi:hypothetical protein